eukprot:1848462-Alexandrium_andersonii.AAC.1
MPWTTHRENNLSHRLAVLAALACCAMRTLCHNVCAVQNAWARPRAVTLTRRRVTESLFTLGGLLHAMACSRTLADH